MFEEENPQTIEEIDHLMAAPYYGLIEEIRVMLVDNDKEFVTKMVDLLKSYGYKVTTAGTTSAAISMLSKGKVRFDVIIIKAHSLNMLSLDLLAKAVAIDIISLFVCDEHNELVAKKVLEKGAYLYLKYSFDKEIMKYLWQFVLTEQIQRQKVREGSKIKRGQIMNVVDINNIHIVGESGESGEKKDTSSTEEQRNDIQEDENDMGSNKKYKLTMKRGRKSTNEIDERESQSSDINMVVKKKTCKLWNDDLHAKFMKAVQLFGKEKCQPKEILDEMNVLDLTRTQVASYLQSCRLKNWKFSEEQKSTRHPSGQRSSKSSRQKHTFQKVEKIPFLQPNVPNLQHNSNQIQEFPKFSFPIPNTNNVLFEGESSIQQLYHPQLQAQSQHHTIDNQFNSPCLSTQNNFNGGLQQQRGPLFGVLGSQGPQRSVIENTSYRPNLDFNSGYHNTQSSYNLNHNVFHGAIYSGSKKTSGTNIKSTTIYDNNLNATATNVTTYLGRGMIPDTHDENTTINGLGAINTNFQQDSSISNMSNPSNIVAASYESDNEESNSNGKKNWDAYFDFSNLDYLSQNLEPPSTHPPDE